MTTEEFKNKVIDLYKKYNQTDFTILVDALINQFKSDVCKKHCEECNWTFVKKGIADKSGELNIPEPD